jgi:hypothetical protein
MQARTKPAAAKVAHSKIDNGSGADTLSEPTPDEDEDEDEDEDDPDVDDELEEDEEPDDELVGSRVIVTPEVPDTSWGGLLTLVTLSEKLRTPLAASPWP